MMVDVVVDTRGLAEREQRLLALLVERVHGVFAAAAERGVPVEAFGDLDAVVDAMASALPTGHVYDQLVGPFYDTAGLAAWLGVSRQALSKRVGVRKLIACPLEDGSLVYPVWQFTGGAVDPAMLRVWQALRAHGDPWTSAQWMCSDVAGAPGSSAVAQLRGGAAVDPVAAAAAADAAGWAA